MVMVGPAGALPQQSNLTENSAALARLASIAGQTTNKAFATELARATTGHPQSDSSGPQQNTNVSGQARIGVFSPASANAAATASTTTSAGSGRPVTKRRRGTKSASGVTSKR